MSQVASVGRWGGVSRIALVALIGSVASACSSDRLQLSDSPFSNPFATSQRLAAVDPQPAPQAAAPAQVAAMPTAPVQSQALPPISAPTARGVASNAPVTSSSGGWSAAGGTRITLGAGDSLNTVSQRYGVPTNAILQANGLASAAQIQPGASIVIPVYSATGQAPQPTRVASVSPVATPAPTPSRVAAAAPAAPQPKFRFVEGPKPAAQPAEAPKARTRPGMVTTAKAEPVKPAPVQTAKAEPAKPAPAAPQAAKAAPAQPAPQAVAQKPAEPVKVAAIETKPVAAPAPAPVAVAPQPQPQPAKAPIKEPEETASLPKEPTADFRWPARGRVIAGFGANGGNEGINIAVPEGTPVKAAEAGTVTYAGNEVRGYGNLVLIKHDNGYISAYAHNGELNVKRGERVTRGQVVAKSGQTGNVTSPQLHFEIRKGQTPVDPLSYLSGN